MNYDELCKVYSDAWRAFYDVLEDNGIDSSNQLHSLLDSKDCFNDVFDCVMEVATLKGEDA